LSANGKQLTGHGQLGLPCDRRRHSHDHRDSGRHQRPVPAP
jgi:hypothetical protein